MLKRDQRSAPLLAALLAAAAAQSASAARLDNVATATMMALEPAVEVSPAPAPADGLVDATIDIPAPPSAVWRVLFDCARAPAVMPNLTRCDVIAAGENWDEREHRVRWITLLPEITSRFRSTYTQNTRIAFVRTGGDLNALEGEWRLEPISGGHATRLVYRANVGFGALVPSFMIRSALVADVPGFLKAIRKEALQELRID